MDGGLTVRLQPSNPSLPLPPSVFLLPRRVCLLVKIWLLISACGAWWYTICDLSYKCWRKGDIYFIGLWSFLCSRQCRLDRVWFLICSAPPLTVLCSPFRTFVLLLSASLSRCQIRLCSDRHEHCVRKNAASSFVLRLLPRCCRDPMAEENDEECSVIQQHLYFDLAQLL